MDLQLLLIAVLSAVLGGAGAQQGKNRDMSEICSNSAVFAYLDCLNISSAKTLHVFQLC